MHEHFSISEETTAGNLEMFLKSKKQEREILYVSPRRTQILQQGYEQWSLQTD